MTRWWCVLVSVVPFVTLGALASCGGDEGGTGGTAPRSPSPSRSTTAVVPTPFSPSPAVTRADVDGAIVVVRKDTGGPWTLWRVTPAAGVEARLAELPFEPSAATPSPARTKVVYQPLMWRKKLALKLAVLDVASGRVKTIAVRGGQLRQVSTLTWLSESQLLVSGPPPGIRSGPEVDLLVQVNAKTGAGSSFRGLQGSDPDAATESGKLVYVTAEKAPEGGGAYDGPAVRETLMMASLDNESAPAPVVEGYGNDPELTAAHRVMAEPSLSPDGAYVLTVETGSDPQLTYTLRGVDDASVLFDKFVYGNPSGEWSADGRVAFWGIGPVRPNAMRIWVYAVASRAMVRSPRLQDAMWVNGLAWSPANHLAVGVMGGDPGDPQSEVWVSRGARLDDLTAVAAGALPVWVE